MTDLPTAVPPPRLHCPFCGAEEQERLRMEDHRVVVFPCMFAPVFDSTLDEEGLRAALARYGAEGPAYFQKQCDRLHYFVTKGAGAVMPGSSPRSE